MDLDLFAMGSIDDHIFDLVRIFFKRCFQTEVVFLCKSIQNRSRKTSFICTGLPAQHHNGPLGNAQTPVRYHQVHIKLHFISQAEAGRTGTERIVEGKASRFDLINAHTAVRTGKALAEI